MNTKVNIVSGINLKFKIHIWDPVYLTLKGTVKEKSKGGIGWNMRFSGVERYL